MSAIPPSNRTPSLFVSRPQGNGSTLVSYLEKAHNREEIIGQREFDTLQAENDRLIVQRADLLSLPVEMVERAVQRLAARHDLSALSCATEVIQ